MRATKPDKPHKDFPLTAHPSGTWCKKIKGKIYHFGGWSDPEGALAKYRHQVDDLQAGRVPGELPGARLTLADLCNHFLESKATRAETGTMTQRQFLDYKRACQRLLLILGRTGIVENMRPDDFSQLAGKLAAGVSVVTLANRIRLTRAVFRFAYESGRIPSPLRFGENFRVPGKAILRAERHRKGAIDFNRDELTALIGAAGVPLKAMILLGINCGLGNTDCASLPMSAVDLESGWLNFPRPKTAVARRAALWPETVEAVKAALAKRPKRIAPEAAGLLFVTKYGKAYARLSENGFNCDAIAGEFAKFLKGLGLNGRRRAFYSLRRTFETVAGDTCDQAAVDLVMGHTDPSMAGVYRQRIPDARLRAVADYVRGWLWPAVPSGNPVPADESIGLGVG